MSVCRRYLASAEADSQLKLHVGWLSAKIRADSYGHSVCTWGVKCKRVDSARRNRARYRVGYSYATFSWTIFVNWLT